MMKINIKTKLSEQPHADSSEWEDDIKTLDGDVPQEYQPKLKLPEGFYDVVDFMFEMHPSFKGIQNGEHFIAPFKIKGKEDKKVYIEFIYNPLEIKIDNMYKTKPSISDKIKTLPDDWMKHPLKRYAPSDDPDEYMEEAKSGNWHSEREIPPAGRGMEESLEEKKDRCYKKAKRKFKVFPSAYAGAYIARCRKGKIKGKSKKNERKQTIKEALEEVIFDFLKEEKK